MGVVLPSGNERGARISAIIAHGNTTGTQAFSIAGSCRFAGGDTFELRVIQNSGGNLGVGAYSSALRAYVSVVLH